ncbi:hypothetical protein E3Q24_00441 [Wallemia mellicola]|nr:hypothetical protein E3Q24_00441 [Wallemia mellicola]
MSARRAHIMLLSDDGHVYQSTSCALSHRIIHPLLVNDEIEQISAGWTHSAIFTKKGNIMVYWPLDYADSETYRANHENGPRQRVERGVEFIDTHVFDFTPPSITLPSIPNETISKIASAEGAILALTQNGRLYRIDLHGRRGLRGEEAVRNIADLIANGEKRWIELTSFSPQNLQKLLPEGAATPVLSHITSTFRQFTLYAPSVAHSRVFTGDATSNNSKPQLIDLDNVIDVVRGDYHSIALTRSGEVRSFGSQNGGALGVASLDYTRNGTVTTPLPVQFGGNKRKFAFTIAAAGWHSAALVIDLEGDDGDPPETVEETRCKTAKSSLREMQDPLLAFPPELVLRILAELDVQSLSNMRTSNKSWNTFIDVHEDVLFNVVRDKFGRMYDDIWKTTETIGAGYNECSNWRDYFRNDNRINENLKSDAPKVFERFVNTGNTLTWRFKPDFEKQFVVVTAHQGGVKVFDINTSELLWEIPEADVRPHAHLEYSNGYFCIDRFGNALEVWRRNDIENQYRSEDNKVEEKRGHFTRVTILPHERETRGFQLCYPHLSVVSSEGHGYLYDVAGAPSLVRQIDIESGAIGHLDQCPTAIAFSIGTHGYHFHSKEDGRLLGVFPPEESNLTPANFFHVHHPQPPMPGSSARTEEISNQHIASTRIGRGKLKDHPSERTMPQDLPALRSDDWGAGMIDGPYFVGISRSGRLVLCSDWEATLAEPNLASQTVSVLESETDDSRFDLGGWLSVRHGKVLFEVSDRIYILHLPAQGELINPENSPPIQTLPSNSYAQLPVPISYMSVHSDAIMSTYATLLFNAVRIGVAKHIRISSFAGQVDDESKWIDPQSPENEDPHRNFILEVMTEHHEHMVMPDAEDQIEDIIEEFDQEDGDWEDVDSEEEEGGENNSAEERTADGS